MPKDQSGKFHLNSQQASAADRAPKPKHHEAPTGGGGGMQGGADGQEHIGHHLMTQAAEHGGKHIHAVQNDDGSLTSHHVDHDGQVQGPHDHANLEALKNHMSQFFDEEGKEWEGRSGEADGNYGGGAPHHALHGM